MGLEIDIATLTYLMFGSLICIFLPERITNKLDQALAFLIGPSSKNVRSLMIAATESVNVPQLQSVSIEEYDLLQEKLLRTETRLQNIVQEFNILSDRLLETTLINNTPGMMGTRLFLANITGSDPSQKKRILHFQHSHGESISEKQIVLAKVTKDQLVDDDTTDPINDIYQMAVIGKVIQSGSNNGRIQALTDPLFRLSVVIKPPDAGSEFHSDITGSLRGNGSEPITIDHISTEVEILEGDAVFIKAGNKTLPANFILGYISSCRPAEDNATIWHIEVKPLVDLDNLQSVVIVSNQSN